VASEVSIKPVIWLGSSRKDLREFPAPVRDHMGYALYVAQLGGKHRDAKAADRIRRGWGAGSREGLSRVTPSARCIRCVLPGRIYVLHAFQKKSKTGRETPRRDVELIQQRLRQAEQIARGTI